MTGTAPSDGGETLISMEELGLAARNHGMPVEVTVQEGAGAEGQGA